MAQVESLQYPIPGHSSPEETRDFHARFDVRYHTLVKSYTFLSKEDGWYQIDIPFFEETDREEVIPYDHEELSYKLEQSQADDPLVTEEGGDHRYTEEALVALHDFIHPKLVPLQGSPIVNASAYREVEFRDDGGKVISTSDVVYILPDMSIVNIEVGKKNGRIKQVRKQVRGLEIMSGQQLTIYNFFCHYDFADQVSPSHNMTVPAKRLTFRPINLQLI